MFSNLQIRPAKPHGRKSSMAARSGVSKRRISHAFTSPNEVPSVSFMENLFGEEFPEAFVDGVGRCTSRSRKSIMDLPAEILALVGDHLSKMDLKRLRLANQYLAANVNLRIDRVYISPNRANLNHLRRILDHPQYKYQVREIVWDEALLDHYPDLNSFREALEDDAIHDRRELEKLFACAILGHDDASADYRTFEIDDFFEDGRLTEAGKSILLQQDGPFSRKILALNATTLMTVEDSYDFYQTLYRQQQGIICQNMDSEALLQALKGCPNVRRVTVTSEVWRTWHINPIYDTPFHRSLPPGFRKPTVSPWLEDQPLWQHLIGRTRSVHNHGPIDLNQNPGLGLEWHGYKTVVAVLSKSHYPGITEFIVDSGHEHTGIGHHLFAAPNKDFDLTIAMADHLPLKRLNFSINTFYLTNGREDDYLTSGYLKAMFEHMPYLEHLDFNPHCIQRRPSKQPSLDKTIEFEHVFPVEMLRRLRTFTLRNAHVRSDQLLDLIASLHTAENIMLDNISTGNILMLIKSDWQSFFMHLYAYYERMLSISHTGSIPRFTFILPQSSALYGTARCHLIDEELDAFLSGRAGLPFSDRHSIHKNAGWIIDDRDPGFRIRPSAEYWAAEEDYMNRQAANDSERYTYDEELEWRR